MTIRNVGGFHSVCCESLREKQEVSGRRIGPRVQPQLFPVSPDCLPKYYGFSLNNIPDSHLFTHICLRIAKLTLHLFLVTLSMRGQGWSRTAWRRKVNSDQALPSNGSFCEPPRHPQWVLPYLPPHPLLVSHCNA